MPILTFENNQKLEKQLVNAEKVGAIFIELSKKFNPMNHILILAKLKAIVISDQALKFITKQSVTDSREA